MTINAQIIYDNVSDKLVVPANMGICNENQLKGSNLDNLVELGGRVCYDSLGAKNSRGSKEYHEHIVEVKHGSVQEHANLTFSIYNNTECNLPAICFNRPGLSMICCHKDKDKELSNNDPLYFRITANLRVIREWDYFTEYNNLAHSEYQDEVGKILKYLAYEKAPLVLFDQKVDKLSAKIWDWMNPEVVQPYYDSEIWISFYFSGLSRGFSHELVRHKWRTGVSQRSTRYVDESESEWAWHPLLRKYWDEVISIRSGNISIGDCVSSDERTCEHTYIALVNFLQEKLVSEGIDKFTARKQARGAARGVLGNALSTELVFSASLDQWERMTFSGTSARATNAADAEIRLAFNKVFEEMCNSGFWAKEDFNLIPAKDGLGFHIEEKK